MRLLILAVVVIAFSCKNAETEKPTPSETRSEEMVSLELTIDGMTCTGCESTIEGKVLSLEGITSVEASHATANAQITSELSSLDTILIKETIEGAGYTVVSIAILE